MAKASTQKTGGTLLGGMSIGRDLALGALIAELLGSALLAFAVLMAGNNPIVAAVTVIVGVLIFAELSGGHLNPVVTIVACVLKNITWVKALGYIVVQVLGAVLAYVIVAKFMADSTIFTLFTPEDQVQALEQYGQASQAHVPGEWKPIFGELVGSIIFAFGAASAFLYKKVGFDRAFTIGGALMVGLIAALAGSYAVVNPAVAVSVGAFSQGGWWSFAAYGLAPIVGAAIGAGLFKLLKQDVEAVDKKK